MKNLFLLSFFVLTVLGQRAWACSIEVNEMQTTNALITAAANEFNIPLTKVSKMQATGFAYRLYGNVPGSSCEHYLEFKANITINYQPSIFQKCELSVEAVLTQDLQAESYPFEAYTFNFPASSCVRIPIRFPRI